jgi:hypothetical protein
MNRICLFIRHDNEVYPDVSHDNGVYLGVNHDNEVYSDVSHDNRSKWTDTSNESIK